MPNDLIPFEIFTNETLFRKKCPTKLIPPAGNEFSTFYFDDPFGLRQAILPLFWNENGRLTCRGTAFAVDPWGSLVTADHVIDELRQKHGLRQQSGLRFEAVADREAGHVALLGFAATFGRVRIPDEAFVSVIASTTHGSVGDNPLLQLSGKPDFRPIDLAFLETTPPTPEMMQSLITEPTPSIPTVGEVVLAIGYPERERDNDFLASGVNVVTAQMSAAYGVVSAVGRESAYGADKTPVFQVRSKWHSGMSGGPVLNSKGEVIGVVSRSFDYDEAFEGLSVAVCLGRLPLIGRWAPSLVVGSRDLRQVWAVLNAEMDIVHLTSAKNDLVDFLEAYDATPLVAWRALADVRIRAVRLLEVEPKPLVRRGMP